MRRFAALFALLMTGVVSCGSAPRPNILLVVVDTLRWDRLGCYGSGRGVTPFLDSLAERGFVMHRAYAQSSWTSPSIASLFTSRFQSQHGVIRKGSVPWPQEVSLAEVLRDNGYVAGGFSANGLLRGSPGGGFGQGFAYYEAKAPKRTEGIRSPALWETARADEINREAMKWFDELPEIRKAPVFLYLHYMEPHIPYAPEEEFLRHTFAGRDLPDVSQVNRFAYRGNGIPLADATLRDIQAVYDAGVMSVDAGLRRLFSELDRRGFLDEAIVVITADHGEEFMEHGMLGHGQTLYEELIRVPLLILLPGQADRVDVRDVVSLVDVAPTLVEALRIERPDSFEGRSFQADLRRYSTWWRRLFTDMTRLVPSMHRVAYSELFLEKDSKRPSPHERAVVWDEAKMIVGIRGEMEFYDVGTDPGEKNPLALSESRRVTLRESLASLQTNVSRHRAESGPDTPDAATEEILRALGYAED